ncbi:GtrA family protein [Cellulomonas sp. 179-A 4D5 NHS]|uniref:GtrA family protein n=1 Tax=Cellulomonas sp. 179-A 4D5 NHS TaxID=3142378 RepID=UPI0039A1D47E
MVILVPALEPDDRLLELLRALRTAAPQDALVVVDDGSGPRYAGVFDAARTLGATVLTHPTNRGKGAALRTGIAHVLSEHPGQDVVAADCDGQHTVADILRVAARVDRGQAIVLGARQFTGPVPARSRIGNATTRVLFGLATRHPLQDTQTGLRGYPAHLLEWLLSVPGDRFEYELAVLLRAPAAGHVIEEIPISTVYLEGNTSSHFRPLADSARVYVPLLRFSVSSLGAFLLDACLLLTLHALTGSLAVSAIAARAASSSVNYLVNRTIVFPTSQRTSPRRSAARYGALVVTMLGVNLVLLTALTHAGVPLVPAKVATEAALFLTSYAVQRRVVFRPQPRTVTPASRPAPATPAGAVP